MGLLVDRWRVLLSNDLNFVDLSNIPFYTAAKHDSDIDSCRQILCIRTMGRWKFQGLIAFERPRTLSPIVWPRMLDKFYGQIISLILGAH